MSARIKFDGAQAIREAARELWEIRHRNGLAALDSVLAQLPDEDLDLISRSWQLAARPEQLRPADSNPIWLRMAGRGEGKTRSAAEHTLDQMEDWGRRFRGILCSKTIGDVRDVMIEGESGLQACAERRGYHVSYIPSKSRIEHPSGAVAYLCSSEQPDKPRGYQSNFVWGDEIAAWKNAITTFDNLLFGWRLPVPHGVPLIVLTTTPKPNPIMFRLVKDPAFKPLVTITGGTTENNRDNLAPAAYAALMAVYKGTTLGRQELDGILLDTLGAIIDQDTIHKYRLNSPPDRMVRRCVALDPSITTNGDAAGIVVVGCDGQQYPHGFVLADMTLEGARFSQWARQAVRAFVAYDCDCIVAELNQGGDGVVEAIETAAASLSIELGREIVVPVRGVWAQKSKRARAEPIGALYEQGRVHHVGFFESLEKELTTWVPGMASPNRMDAVVHGLAHLLLGDKGVGPIDGYWSESA